MDQLCEAAITFHKNLFIYGSLCNEIMRILKCVSAIQFIFDRGPVHMMKHQKN